MSIFSVQPLLSENLSDCAALLADRECWCVSLMSRFMCKGRILFPKDAQNSFWTVYKQISGKKKRTLSAVISGARGGLLLHCISPEMVNSAVECENFCKVMEPILSAVKPMCIMGNEFGTNLLKKACELPTRVEWLYDLMEFPSCIESTQAEPSNKKTLVPLISAEKEDEVGIILHSKYYVRRCRIADADVLYPLRKAYELEEVLPPGDIHSDSACMTGLRKSLEQQQIFAVFDADKKTPLATAGTNAQGFAWSQIGGVYTVPSARGQGFARTLVRFLADKLAAEDKRAVLFVKKINEYARRSYSHAGFMAAGLFKVTYY